MNTAPAGSNFAAAPVHRPIQGSTTLTRQPRNFGAAPDPIQTHARAVNSLRMALHYLNQAESNVSGAGRKAVQALAAISQLTGVRALPESDEFRKIAR